MKAKTKNDDDGCFLSGGGQGKQKRGKSLRWLEEQFLAASDELGRQPLSNRGALASRRRSRGAWRGCGWHVARLTSDEAARQSEDVVWRTTITGAHAAELVFERRDAVDAARRTRPEAAPRRLPPPGEQQTCAARSYPTFGRRRLRRWRRRRRRLDVTNVKRRYNEASDQANMRSRSSLAPRRPRLARMSQTRKR